MNDPAGLLTTVARTALPYALLIVEHRRDEVLCVGAHDDLVRLFGAERLPPHDGSSQVLLAVLARKTVLDALATKGRRDAPASAPRVFDAPARELYLHVLVATAEGTHCNSIPLLALALLAEESPAAEVTSVTRGDRLDPKGGPRH